VHRPLRVVAAALIVVAAGAAVVVLTARDRDPAAQSPMRATDDGAPSSSTPSYAPTPASDSAGRTPQTTGRVEKGPSDDADADDDQTAARASEPIPQRAAAGVAARLEAIAKVAAAARAAALTRGAAPVTQVPDANGIRTAMRDAVPMLKECYEPWAEMNPELQGKLTARFIIGPDGGTPHNVGVVEGGLGSEALDGCVLSVIESEMRFTRSSNGEPVEVTYPLRFSTDDEAASATR
jgi:hypothetical protein